MIYCIFTLGRDLDKQRSPLFRQYLFIPLILLEKALYLWQLTKVYVVADLTQAQVVTLQYVPEFQMVISFCYFRIVLTQVQTVLQVLLQRIFECE